MTARKDHFMPASLLQSQLETLEPLEADEPGFTVDVELPAGAIVDEVLDQLH
jgi:gluconate kinase